MNTSTTLSTKPVFGPYSPIRQTKAGTLYFVSGQVGVNPDTKQAPESVAEQTHQVLRNMRATLESAGLTMNDVVKTIIFVTNIDDFAAVNEVYTTYFDDPRPARSTVGVQSLPKVGGDVLIKVEIEAIACRAQEPGQ